MGRIKTKFNVRLLEEDKEFIKNRAEEFGYKTVSAFIVDSAKSHFKIEVDMKVYRDLTKEINYIGKNINSLIRRINTDGIYTDNDIDFLRINQKKIIKLINTEYDRLLDLKTKFNSDSLSKKQKEKLIKSLTENQMEIPKKLLLEEVYEKIKEDFVYIIECIENSPEQDKEVTEYVWQYLYGDTLFKLNDNQLIKLADSIFIFAQKLKFKLSKLDNVFSDDDWFELKDILDEYEIY
ncbi:plasmid mobilization protein [Bacillus nitratireducens]|uniref:plasmid mobilization protein n=1 Tax=Bacillus nitratireducens TaxID=2026193 RepID=UPI003395B06A